MYRKILLISISIFEGLSLFVKCFLIASVLFASLIIFARFKPYKTKEINEIEMEAAATIVLISFLGCVYVCNIGWIWQTLLFAFVVVINTIFLIRWLIGFLTVNLLIYHNKISERFPNILNKLMAFVLLIKQLQSKKISLGRLLFHFKINQNNFRSYYQKEKGNLKRTMVLCQNIMVKKKKIYFAKITKKSPLDF